MVKIGIEGSAIAKFRTTIWEENHAALRMARLEPGRMTPRYKHYGVKYHWFRTKLKPNDVEISPVASAEERAEFMTKSLISVFHGQQKAHNGLVRLHNRGNVSIAIKKASYVLSKCLLGHIERLQRHILGYMCVVTSD
jgi:hypothetical protein